MSNDKVVDLQGKPVQPAPSVNEKPGMRALVDEVDKVVREGAGQLMIVYCTKDGIYETAWQGNKITLLGMCSRAAHAINGVMDKTQET